MKLDLLLFNVQDLYVFMDKYQGEDLEVMREPQWQLLSTSFYPNKQLQKVYAIRDIILETDPDVVMLVEVGGLQSLKNFNKYFLNSNYEIHFEESNSDRGIDIGYLCKKNIPDVSFYMIGHNGEKLKNGKRFARGLLELRVMQKGRLQATLLLTHLKSKLDLKKQDFEGRGLRGSEVAFIVKHFKKLQISHPKVPVLVCGDLNGVIYKSETEEELAPFAQAGLHDVLELLDRDLDERQTYFFFTKGNRIPMQLDYILMPSRFKDMVDPITKVLPMEPELVPHPPESLAQKKKLPSDHYPLFCRINL